MPIAGFCDACGQNVWCDESGNCAQGHPKSQVHDWYDPDTGARLYLGAPAAAGPRDAIVTEVTRALQAKTGYAVAPGADSDLVIASEIANAAWHTGKKKVEYEAVMTVNEPERTVFWWEILKESGSGLSFGTMSAETFTISGTRRSGTRSEVIFGPDGVAVDFSWDYAQTRKLAEEIAAAHGFKLKVVLRKKSAQR